MALGFSPFPMLPPGPPPRYGRFRAHLRSWPVVSIAGQTTSALWVMSPQAIRNLYKPRARVAPRSTLGNYREPILGVEKESIRFLKRGGSRCRIAWATKVRSFDLPTSTILQRSSGTAAPVVGVGNGCKGPSIEGRCRSTSNAVICLNDAEQGIGVLLPSGPRQSWRPFSKLPLAHPANLTDTSFDPESGLFQISGTDAAFLRVSSLQLAL